MQIAFPPPLRWQDFEELTKEVFREVFFDPGAQCHGRSGQDQHGVDVFGTELGAGRRLGVQCKQRGKFELAKVTTLEPATTVTFKEVTAEVAQAEHFRPALQHFFLATTGTRDTEVQREVRTMSDERTTAGKFGISLWFWEDYIGFINNYAPVAKWYSSYASTAYGDRLNDIQILTVLQTAMSRPAFRTALVAETPGDLLQAILDTNRVVGTGLLLDRETRLPICRAPGGVQRLSRDPQKLGSELVDVLAALREKLESGIETGRMRVCQAHYHFEDASIVGEIDGLRSRAVQTVNQLLLQHGLTPVPNPLG